jgi:hypothetical protein
MTKEQAYQIIVNVCLGISATRQDHKVIDQALAILKPEKVEPVKE